MRWLLLGLVVVAVDQALYWAGALSSSGYPAFGIPLAMFGGIGVGLLGFGAARGWIDDY